MTSPAATAAPAFMSWARVEPPGHSSRARPATAAVVASTSPAAATISSALSMPGRRVT